MNKSTNQKVFSIGNLTSLDEDKDVLSDISIESIEPDPDQDRSDWDDEDTIEHINAIALSAQKYGIREPIKVLPIGKNKYKIIDGECRYRAAQKIDLDFIPAIIRTDISQQQASVDMLQSSVNKLKLKPYFLAKALQKRISQGWTQKDLSEALGKSPAWVSQRLAVLNTSDEVQELAKQGVINDAQSLNKLDQFQQEERDRAIDEIKKGRSVKDILLEKKKNNSKVFSIPSDKAVLILKTFGIETTQKEENLEKTWQDFIQNLL